MNDKDLHAYCIHWVEWRRSYYLYIPINPDSPPKQFYPLSKELDADQQEEMKTFDMAVATMKNMDQYNVPFPIHALTFSAKKSDS